MVTDVGNTEIRDVELRSGRSALVLQMRITAGAARVDELVRLLRRNADGTIAAVTTAVAVPLTVPLVAFTIVLPTAPPSATPDELLMLAVPAASDDHTKVVENGCPF